MKRRREIERSGTPTRPIRVRPVDRRDWPAVVRLFGERGACGGCWCMWWRVPRGGKLWEEVKGARNRESLRRLIRAGEVHAILAFSGDEPVGWCCFGPRSTFPRLETVRALKRKGSPGTWAIVCLFIKSGWRRRGVGSRLVEVASAEAFARGAEEVEGYPAVSSRPGAPVPASFAWTGVPLQFRRAGFRKLSRRGVSRPIYLKRPS